MTDENQPFEADILTMRFSTVVLAVAATASPLSAAAQEAPGVEFELGAGVLTQPQFEGSKDYLVSAYPTFRFKRLTFTNGFQLGGGDGLGFSAYPSFRIVGERDPADNANLVGLDVVDTAVELGLGASYTTTYASAFVQVRKGVTGHDGIVAEFGADAVLRPRDDVTVKIGPRLSFADDSYMDTYFGVSAAEAAASSFGAYDPSGGFKSAGVEANIRYDFAENWAVEGTAGWDRLIGDAADSPIVTMAGSKDQFRVGVGVVRKFRIDF